MNKNELLINLIGYMSYFLAFKFKIDFNCSLNIKNNTSSIPMVTLLSY